MPTAQVPAALDTVFRPALERTAVAMLVADCEGVITVANATCEQLFGFAPGQLIGHALAELLPPGTWEAEDGPIQRLLSGRTALAEHDLRYLLEDGSRRVYGHASFVLLRNPGGQPEAIVGLVEDVKRRHAVEQTLHVADAILRHVPSLILIADRTGRVQYISPSVEQMLGYSPAELSGAGWNRLIYRVNASEPVASAPDTTPSMPYEEQLQAADGTPRWILWQDAPGPNQIVVRVGQDVTTRRNFEKQLANAQKLEAVAQLAAGIAHDFNNFLTSVALFGGLIKAGLHRDDHKRLWYAQEVLEAAARGQALTQQLLTFSRKQQMFPTTLDMNRELLALRPMLASMLGERVRLELTLAAEEALAYIDTVEFQQVLLNLVINAKDAMGEGGTVSVATLVLSQEQPPRVVLTVADTGAGIPPELQDRIFDPFFTTKAAGRGTGLGLAIVCGIVNRARGSIHFASQAGMGTRFSITFPLSAQPVEGRPSEAGSRATVLAGATILLVEDDPAVRLSITEVLRGLHYEVMEAGGRREAVEKAASSAALDLIITDVVLPDGSGPELVQQLREKRPEALALFISGYAPSELAHAGTPLSTQTLLRKPFSMQALNDKVAALLQERATGIP